MAQLNQFTNSGLEAQASQSVAPAQQPQQELPTGVPQGTVITRCMINKNWTPGSNTWMANVDIITDERLYLNNINVRQRKDGSGLYVDYPKKDRIRNGQVVKNEQGYNEKDPYYIPFKNDDVDGINMMANQMIIPMAQQANASPDGKYVEDPNNFGLSSYFYKSQYSYAYGRVVTQGLPIRVFGLWLRGKQNEDGSITPVVSWPSAPQMKNGVQVMDNQGRPQYTRFVYPSKECKDTITEAIALHVQKKMEESVQG